MNNCVFLPHILTFICLLNFGINAEVGNRTAYNFFTSAMQYPIKLLEDRYSKLDLEGRPVTVLPYANEEDCKIIMDALKNFDPDYSDEYRSKSQLKNMPVISKFINCPLHTRMTEHSLEFRL